MKNPTLNTFGLKGRLPEDYCKITGRLPGITGQEFKS
jgi:hypothetical protein